MLKYKEEFNSIEAVNERIYSFNYGKVNEVSFGPHSFIISSTENPEHLFYCSETDDKSYNYTIEIYSNLYILYVYSFHKNKMINAAENGDLEMFIENFTDSAKMKEFAL